MRITAAPWETRNLGMTCQELQINSSDNLAALIEALESLNAQIQVARLPPAQQDLVHELARRGFVFAEVMLCFEHDGVLPEPRSVVRRIDKATAQRQASDHDFQLILEAIQRGIFSTDRISLHPAFTGVQAAGRYCNWLNDEVQLGASIQTLVMRGQPVAFFSIRESKSHPVIALSGVLSPNAMPGIGTVLQRRIVTYAFDSDLGPVQTHVSSNNMPAVRAHLDAGFQLAAIENVFMRVTP